MTTPVPAAPPDESTRAASVMGRNVALLFGDRALRLAVGFVVNVWIIRHLGPAGLGVLGFSQNLVALTAVLAEVGLESILIRELVRRPGDAPRLLATAALLRFAASGVAIALAAGAVLGLRPADPTAWTVVLILASATAFQALDVLAFWFQSGSRFAPLIAARGAAFAIATTAKVACLMLGAGLVPLAAAIALEAWLAAGALAIAYRRAGGRWHEWRATRAEAVRLWRDAWPLVLNSLALVVAARLDQIVLIQLRGAAENGLYAAAQRLFEIMHFVPSAVAAAAAPGLILAHAESREHHRERLGRLLRRLFWIAAGLAALTSWFAGSLVQALFGAEFRGSGTVLAVLVWSAPATFLGVVQSNWFIVEGRTGGLLLRSAVAAVVVLVLNLLLVPRHGALGAAIALVAAQTMAHIGVNALEPAARPLLRLQLRALLPWGRP